MFCYEGRNRDWWMNVELMVHAAMRKACRICENRRRDVSPRRRNFVSRKARERQDYTEFWSLREITANLPETRNVRRTAASCAYYNTLDRPRSPKRARACRRIFRSSLSALIASIINHNSENNTMRRDPLMAMEATARNDRRGDISRERERKRARG